MFLCFLKQVLFRNARIYPNSHFPVFQWQLLVDLEVELLQSVCSPSQFHHTHWQAETEKLRRGVSVVIQFRVLFGIIRSEFLLIVLGSHPVKDHLDSFAITANGLALEVEVVEANERGVWQPG